MFAVYTQNINHNDNTSISADADGSRDSRPIDHIALHTELDADEITSQRAPVDIESSFLHRPTVVDCQHIRAR